MDFTCVEVVAAAAATHSSSVAIVASPRECVLSRSKNEAMSNLLVSRLPHNAPALMRRVSNGTIWTPPRL